jgi:predicted nicotinamide N-methyase
MDTPDPLPSVVAPKWPHESVGALRARLARDYDLVHRRLMIGGRRFKLAHPRAMEALIDHEEFRRDERLPYWARLWPSAITLAGAVLERAGQVTGRQVIELGCGLGLPSIAAAAVGARVLATDYYDAALEFVRYNSLVNLGFPIASLNLDWRKPPSGLGRFDLVLASDVLYERRDVAPLAALVPQLVANGGEVWLAEPGRPAAAAFLELLRELGWTVDRLSRASPAADPSVMIHRLYRRA